MGTAQTTFAGERWGTTGSHVTGRGPDGKWPDRNYVLRMPGFPPRFFLTIVVENVIQ
jgi:hypothetical protein